LKTFDKHLYPPFPHSFKDTDFLVAILDQAKGELLHKAIIAFGC